MRFPFHIGEAIVSLFYIFIPWLLSFLHITIKGRRSFKKIDVYFFYYLLIGVAIQATATGIVQMFFPHKVVEIVAWPASPFLLELGMANLSYGIVAFISMGLNDDWRRAIALGYGVFLILTGIGHVVDIIQNGFSPGSSGFFLFSDLLVGFILLFLVIFKNHKS